MDNTQSIKDIETQLNNLEEQKKELLLMDLFLKSKLILEFLKIDEFIIEKQEDLVSGNIFEDFPMCSITINDKGDYHDFNQILGKINLSIADLDIGPILQKDTKITTDMNWEKFKKSISSTKKKKI